MPIIKNHTLHIVRENKTLETLLGVIILVNKEETVFHVKEDPPQELIEVVNQT